MSTRAWVLTLLTLAALGGVLRGVDAAAGSPPETATAGSLIGGVGAGVDDGAVVVTPGVVTKPAARAAAVAPATDRPAVEGYVYPREVTVPSGLQLPVPATKVTEATQIPTAPLDGRHGRRLVYDKALMTVWAIGADDRVLKRFPVVGRWDRPAKGVYKIYSKSTSSSNPYSKVTFNHMVRFAWGIRTTASIGFHAIPRYYDGRAMHPESALGTAIALGGCVRLAERDAAWIYDWSRIGDTVVVLPSPDTA